MHELVHATRIMQGKMSRIPLKGPLIRYKDEEEFLAVVITNVFASANGTTRLRASYTSPEEVLQPPFDTSEGFLSDPNVAQVLALRYLENLDLFWDLANVRAAKFNPFRELILTNPDKYGVAGWCSSRGCRSGR
jgi:hypothetical protein